MGFVRQLGVMGVLLAACGSAGCGEEGGGATSTGAGSGSGGAASGGSGGSSGSASGAGGSAGSAGGASGSGGTGGGSGGSGQPGCTGAFGASRIVLSTPLGVEIGGATLSPNELELFYAQAAPTASSDVNFMRATRATKADSFSAGTIVPELDAACQAGQRRTMDLSKDGLRAYLVCVPPELPPISGSLRVASRPDLASPFVLDPASFGTVGNSPSISPDELTLYTSYEEGAGLGPTRVFTRASTSEPFGAGSDLVIPGPDIPTAPDIGPDDLSLYFGLSGAIGTSSRPSPTGTFGAPSVVVPVPMTTGLGAPEVSQDCRSLYFIQTGTTTEGFSLLVATR